MDRQDIDALLIGALYSELTPAEEARLATHLESHPTDRGALDDLKVARQAVAESRIFAVQLDPPQHVSALLLQEAHRRAPKRVVAPDENEGWFARFARNFMAHPAMAAAAMLVLVMGGAGLMYMKNGEQQFAAREAGQSSMEMEASDTVAATPAGAAHGSAAINEGSAYKADLYEEQGKAQRQELALDGMGNEERESASDRWQQERKTAERSRDELSKQKAPSRGLQVTTERAPKDFDGDAVFKNDDGDSAASTRNKAAPKPKAPATKSSGSYGGELDYGGGGRTANAVSGAGAAQRPGADSNAGYAQPPANAAPSKGGAAGPTGTATGTTKATDSKAPAQTVTQSPAPPPAPAEAADKPRAATAAPKAEAAPAKEAKKDESSLLAWAKSEHARAVTLAKNGDCTGAANVALAVSSRASSYYSQNMATDRSLKQCAQYINAERDKEAERSQKARASKRVNADEPATTK
jgi:hypothetical protein